MSTRAEHLAAALKAAGTAQDLAQAGEYDGATAYAAVAQAYAAVAEAWSDSEPVTVTKPREPLPEWCGECDGPEAGRRWVATPKLPGEEAYEPRMMRCPRCDPRSPSYKAEKV